MLRRFVLLSALALGSFAPSPAVAQFSYRYDANQQHIGVHGRGIHFDFSRQTVKQSMSPQVTYGPAYPTAVPAQVPLGASAVSPYPGYPASGAPPLGMPPEGGIAPWYLNHDRRVGPYYCWEWRKFYPPTEYCGHAHDPVIVREVVTSREILYFCSDCKAHHTTTWCPQRFKAYGLFIKAQTQYLQQDQPDYRFVPPTYYIPPIPAYPYPYPGYGLGTGYGYGYGAGTGYPYGYGGYPPPPNYYYPGGGHRCTCGDANCRYR